MKKGFALLPAMFMVVTAFANIRLPAVINNNMVLQQQSSVKIWGWGAPSEKVFITTSWSHKTDSAVSSRDGKWEASLQTPAAGGPYTITFKGSNEIVLNNVLIGEVWVCSGQSNMEFSYYNGIKQIKEELPTSYHPNIRFFNITKTSALYPQEDCNATWAICDSNTLKAFSAVGYFFGKKLNEKLNVPIGLINSNWGGTPAEIWTPAVTIARDTILQKAADKRVPEPWGPYKPGFAYNAMIAPITNYAIAGAIWYQGESNTGAAETYNRLFNAMIDSWRTQWNKEFPFYYVQIAPYTYGRKNEGALLREAQAQTSTHKNVGMVVITDLVDDVKNIHPQNKRDVGNRLANWALAETYHQPDMVYKSPVFKDMNVQNGKATISFDNIKTGLQVKGTTITELYVAGEDKIFHAATATIEKGKIVVWSDEVKKPLVVRYGFSNTAIGNLFSTEGLPVAPFRTDNWDAGIY